MRTHMLLVFVLMMVGLMGCAGLRPIVTHGPEEEASRMWVSQGARVYRCADGAEANQPPRPVCVHAPMLSSN